MRKMRISEAIENYKKTKEEKYFLFLSEKFMPLIKSYSCKLPYLEYEECVQELTITLFESIASIRTAENDAASISYIKKAIIHKFYSMKIKGERINQFQFPMSDMDSIYQVNWKTESQYNDCILRFYLKHELMEKSSMEKKLFRLSLLGYSDTEIGLGMGYSRQYINRVKKDILDKKQIKIDLMP